MIEDVVLPQRVNNQFNRCSPLENGQRTPSRDEHDLDEGSSSQSREKSANPFTLNNDSSVVNFSAHLQRAKSLFSNRSYVNQRLKNYRMRNPRSSLYRSTSSLCDNNSVSSNASSAMSSPFYNGQTTFGGASATSRRLNSTFQTDLQLQMHHRPKIPTNLVASKSTSSLNTINGSASMSTTAKRILDVMSKYSTPLTEVRRISNALPTIAETSVLNKRKSLLEADSSSVGNEVDRTKRAIIKPNTPYNRPFGRNPIDSVLTTELHVPSMPELLQLKKLATSTMQIREIANKPDNILNKPILTQVNDTKTKKAVNNHIGDLDASNNNEEITNNNNDAISNVFNSTKQHKNKMRTNLTRRRMGKGDSDDLMPEPVNLPNVTLQMDKKTEIKFSEPFRLQKPEQKVQNNTNNGSIIPFEFKARNALESNKTTSALNKNQTNGEKFFATKKIDNTTAHTMQPTIPSSSSTASTSDFTFNMRPAKSVTKLPNTSTTIFCFSEPIVISTFNSTCSFSKSSQFTFSNPLFLNDDEDISSKSVSIKPFNNFKFESKPVTGITSDSGIVDTTQSFGSTVNKSTDLFATSSSSKNIASSDFAKIVSNAPTQPSPCDMFKPIAVTQNQDKWQCETCLVSNELTVSKCVCCQTENPKGSKSSVESNIKAPATGMAVDEGFKSLVAKQKEGRWECKSCFSQNDKIKMKCACCDAPQPNSSIVSSTSNDKTVATPQKSFTFGSSTTSLGPANPSNDDIFKSIVAKQKNSTWECSVCSAKNDLIKSNCVCCNQRRESTALNSESKSSLSKPVATQFSFGNFGSTTNVSSKFSFGSKPNTLDSIETTQLLPISGSAVETKSKSQLSFGNTTKVNEITPSASVNTHNIGFSSTNTNATKFSFGNSAGCVETQVETTKPDATLKTSKVSMDDGDLFKKIVAEQNSKWECGACMIKNDASKQKCVACETPKEGSSTSDDSKTGTESSLKPSFSFGSAVGSSKTFTFGSKPENKEEMSSTQSIFGSATFDKPNISFQFGSPKSVAATSITSNTFAIQSPSSAFSSPATKLSSGTFGQASNDSNSKSTGNLQFKFGSPSSMNDIKFNATANEHHSKDVTDSVPSTSNVESSVKVLDNVIVKPAANGQTETKGTFSFEQSEAQKRGDQKTRGFGGPNDSVQADNFKCATSSPFTFGKTDASTVKPFNVTSPISLPSTTQATQGTENLFTFGSSPTTNAFQPLQPTFSTPAFSFGTTNSSSATATTTNAMVTQPVFGSFSSTSAPTSSAFKTSNAFGSTTVPTFSATSQVASSNEV